MKQQNPNKMLKAALKQKKDKPSKYKNKRIQYNGVWYQSKKEAKYAINLDWKIKSGEIIRWERQVKFSIDVQSIHICNYYADFKVFYHGLNVRYIDCKGYKKGVAYSIFELKKKLVKACHGIDIIEV